MRFKTQEETRRSRKIKRIRFITQIEIIKSESNWEIKTEEKDRLKRERRRKREKERESEDERAFFCRKGKDREKKFRH